MRFTARAFLELVAETASAELSGMDPEVRTTPSLLQVYFGNPSQHYEVWLRSRVGRLEMGLHFEGPLDENQRRMACLAEAMPQIVAELGPRVDLEQWTERWTRLHETHPLPLLHEGEAEKLGKRLARYVQVLEPIVGPLGPMPPGIAVRVARSTRHRMPGR